MAWSRMLMAGVALLCVGCVPRDVHESTRSELERAKLANADLVRKYNDAVAQCKALEARLQETDGGALRARLRELELENQGLAKAVASSRKFSDAEVATVPGAFNNRGGVALTDGVLFTPGSAALKPTAYPALDAVVELIRTGYRDEVIIIEGHTDNQELNITKDRWGHNMRLACERANSVFEYLVSKGLREDRLLVQGYSFLVPVDPATADTTEGRRLNRRVVLRPGGAKI